MITENKQQRRMHAERWQRTHKSKKQNTNEQHIQSKLQRRMQAERWGVHGDREKYKASAKSENKKAVPQSGEKAPEVTRMHCNMQEIVLINWASDEHIRRKQKENEPKSFNTRFGKRCARMTHGSS